MTELLEDLKELEYRLKREGYEIDHYEVRERIEEPNPLNERAVQRAKGALPLEVASEWESFGEEDYIVEIFMGGDTPLDRLVYEPGKELETVSFSGKEYDLDMEELLEAE